MEKSKNQKGQNIYFRQTPKEFRSAGQAQTYEHIKMNIPYRILSFTKQRLSLAFTVVHGHIQKLRLKLPKDKRE